MYTPIKKIPNMTAHHIWRYHTLGTTTNGQKMYRPEFDYFNDNNLSANFLATVYNAIEEFPHPSRFQKYLLENDLYEMQSNPEEWEETVCNVYRMTMMENLIGASDNHKLTIPQNKVYDVAVDMLNGAVANHYRNKYRHLEDGEGNFKPGHPTFNTVNRYGQLEGPDIDSEIKMIAVDYEVRRMALLNHTNNDGELNVGYGTREELAQWREQEMAAVSGLVKYRTEAARAQEEKLKQSREQSRQAILAAAQNNQPAISPEKQAYITRYRYLANKGYSDKEIRNIMREVRDNPLDPPPLPGVYVEGTEDYDNFLEQQARAKEASHKFFYSLNEQSVKATPVIDSSTLVPIDNGIAKEPTKWQEYPEGMGESLALRDKDIGEVSGSVDARLDTKYWRGNTFNEKLYNEDVINQLVPPLSSFQEPIPFIVAQKASQQGIESTIAATQNPEDEEMNNNFMYNFNGYDVNQPGMGQQPQGGLGGGFGHMANQMANGNPMPQIQPNPGLQLKVTDTGRVCLTYTDAQVLFSYIPRIEEGLSYNIMGISVGCDDMGMPTINGQSCVIMNNFGGSQTLRYMNPWNTALIESASNLIMSINDLNKIQDMMKAGQVSKLSSADGEFFMQNGEVKFRPDCQPNKVMSISAFHDDKATRGIIRGRNISYLSVFNFFGDIWIHHQDYLEKANASGNPIVAGVVAAMRTMAFEAIDTNQIIGSYLEATQMFPGMPQLGKGEADVHPQDITAMIKEVDRIHTAWVNTMSNADKPKVSNKPNVRVSHGVELRPFFEDYTYEEHAKLVDMHTPLGGDPTGDRLASKVGEHERVRFRNMLKICGLMEHEISGLASRDEDAWLMATNRLPIKGASYKLYCEAIYGDFYAMNLFAGFDVDPVLLGQEVKPEVVKAAEKHIPAFEDLNKDEMLAGTLYALRTYKERGRINDAQLAFLNSHGDKVVTPTKPALEAAPVEPAKPEPKKEPSPYDTLFQPDGGEIPQSVGFGPSEHKATDLSEKADTAAASKEEFLRKYIEENNISEDAIRVTLGKDTHVTEKAKAEIEQTPDQKFGIARDNNGNIEDAMFGLGELIRRMENSEFDSGDFLGLGRNLLRTEVDTKGLDAIMEYNPSPATHNMIVECYRRACIDLVESYCGDITNTEDVMGALDDIIADYEDSERDLFRGTVGAYAQTVKNEGPVGITRKQLDALPEAKLEFALEIIFGLNYLDIMEEYFITDNEKEAVPAKSVDMDGYVTKEYFDNAMNELTRRMQAMQETVEKLCDETRRLGDENKAIKETVETFGERLDKFEDRLTALEDKFADFSKDDSVLVEEDRFIPTWVGELEPLDPEELMSNYDVSTTEGKAELIYDINTVLDHIAENEIGEMAKLPEAMQMILLADVETTLTLYQDFFEVKEEEVETVGKLQAASKAALSNREVSPLNAIYGSVTDDVWTTKNLPVHALSAFKEESKASVLALSVSPDGELYRAVRKSAMAFAPAKIVELPLATQIQGYDIWLILKGNTGYEVLLDERVVMNREVHRAYLLGPDAPNALNTKKVIDKAIVQKPQQTLKELRASLGKDVYMYSGATIGELTPQFYHDCLSGGYTTDGKYAQANFMTGQTYLEKGLSSETMEELRAKFQESKDGFAYLDSLYDMFKELNMPMSTKALDKEVDALILEICRYRLNIDIGFEEMTLEDYSTCKDEVIDYLKQEKVYDMVNKILARDLLTRYYIDEELGSLFISKSYLAIYDQYGYCDKIEREGWLDGRANDELMRTVDALYHKMKSFPYSESVQGLKNIRDKMLFVRSDGTAVEIALNPSDLGGYAVTRIHR